MSHIRSWGKARSTCSSLRSGRHISKRNGTSHAAPHFSSASRRSVACCCSTSGASGCRTPRNRPRRPARSVDGRRHRGTRRRRFGARGADRHRRRRPDDDALCGIPSRSRAWTRAVQQRGPVLAGRRLSLWCRRLAGRRHRAMDARHVGDRRDLRSRCAELGGHGRRTGVSRPVPTPRGQPGSGGRDATVVHEDRSAAGPGEHTHADDGDSSDR